MALALTFVVKESITTLKEYYKTVASHHKQKIQMLLIVKQSDVSLTKNELATLVGVNHNSIQSWRKKYVTNGINSLLKDGRGGYKPSLLTAKQRAKVLVRISSATDAFASFKELQTWVNTTFKTEIKYNSLRLYAKRNFGAKMKVARKSHILKDEGKVTTFKKTSVKAAST